MNFITFCVLSFTSIIAFILYHFFDVDILTSLSVIALGFSLKILANWGLMLYDAEMAQRMFTGVMQND